MTFAYLALALVVGAACGVTMAYELRGGARRGPWWEPWALFAACAAVVVVCAALVEHLNKTDPASAAVKGLSVLAVGVGYGLAYWWRRRARRG